MSTFHHNYRLEIDELFKKNNQTYKLNKIYYIQIKDFYSVEFSEQTGLVFLECMEELLSIKTNSSYFERFYSKNKSQQICDFVPLSINFYGTIIYLHSKPNTNDPLGFLACSGETSWHTANFQNNIKWSENNNIKFVNDYAFSFLGVLKGGAIKHTLNNNFKRLLFHVLMEIARTPKPNDRIRDVIMKALELRKMNLFRCFARKTLNEAMEAIENEYNKTTEVDLARQISQMSIAPKQFPLSSQKEMGSFLNETPLYTFGVFANVQYAGRDDALNDQHTLTELWSSLLLLLRDSPTRKSAPNWPRPKFVLQLGDAWNPQQTSSKSLEPDAHRSSESVSELAVFSLASHSSTLPPRTFHVWAIGELNRFTRSELQSQSVLCPSVRSFGFPSVQNATEYSILQKLGFLSSTSPGTNDTALKESPYLYSNSELRSEAEAVSESGDESQDSERFSPIPNVFPGYYSFTYSPSTSTSTLSTSPNPKSTSTCEQSRSGGEGFPGAGVRWRLVALDTYEVFADGRTPQEAPYREAHNTFALHNLSADKNSATGLPFPRYKTFNGPVSLAQLEWFEAQLFAARENNERVIVFAHTPFEYYKLMYENSESWSAPEFMALVSRFKDVVALVLLAHPFRSDSPSSPANQSHSASDVSKTPPSTRTSHSASDVSKTPSSTRTTDGISKDLSGTAPKREPPLLPDDPRTSRPAASACKVVAESDCMARNWLVTDAPSPAAPPAQAAEGLNSLLTYAPADPDSAQPWHMRAPLRLMVPPFLEAPTDREGANAAATVAVFADRLEIRGVGARPHVPHIVLNL